MGRMKPAWYYQRQANEAKARSDYFENRVPTVDTTVNSRGASTTLYYRSLLLTDGTDPLIFRVNVLNSTLAILPAASAGLKDALTSTEFAIPLRSSGVKPSKANWFLGDATPSAVATAWNTRWIRYYAQTAGAHRSIPFTKSAGAFDAGDLQAAFNTLFTGSAGATKLGTNGRAFLTLETAPISINT